MTSPCGKCNTCPCGTSGGAPPPQQPSHRPPPTYVQQPQQQQQQPDSCPYPRAQGPAQGQGPAGCQVSSYQPQEQPGTCAAYNKPQPAPTVQCTCTQNRVRNAPPPAIHADHVTCSRGPREQPPIMETRCTCRDAQKAQVECHCAPPAPAPVQQVPCGPPPQQHVPCGPPPQQQVPCGPPPQQQVQCGPPPQPTHANVTCGSNVRRGPQPYHHHSRNTSCNHCRSQTRRKKCVIQ